MENENPAGLLRHDYRNGIGFFRDPKTGAVTQAKAAVKRLALTDRENARGGGDTAIADNDSAIMQCRLGMKNCQDQLDREFAVQLHAGFFVNANRRVALKCDQRAE